MTRLSLIHGPPLAEEPQQGAHTIPAYLAEVCRHHGPATAVVMYGPGPHRVAWSYDTLYAQSLAVARALIAHGAGKDTRVGVLMANRPEYLAAVFGIAMAGGVTVALSTFSTPEELQHLITVSAIDLLLFDTRVMKQDFAAILSAIPLGPWLTRLIELNSTTDPHPPSGRFISWASFLAAGVDVHEAHVTTRAASITPSDLGGIFFSSGTTGLPKGIVHTQRAFCIQWWRWPRIFAMQEPVTSWTGNGLFWSGNICLMVGTALSTGGTAVLQPTFDADAALAAIEQERVTFLAGRPHQWARVKAAANWAGADLSSLKYITRGEMIAEHPTVHSDWIMPMAFGTTETMTICTAHHANTNTDTNTDTPAGSVGPPLPGNSLKIVDPLSRAILPVGERGEMCIKGPTLMATYLGKAPEQCFDADGFYCTGDGGRIDAQGRFFWDGRLDDLIKTGGANVSPEEVDAAIAAFPGVQRCQTVGVPDDLLGEMVVACIVPLAGAHITEAALITHLRTRLASFKVPRRVLLLQDGEFPVTGNGKARAADIRALVAARLRVQSQSYPP